MSNNGFLNFIASNLLWLEFVIVVCKCNLQNCRKNYDEFCKIHFFNFLFSVVSDINKKPLTTEEPQKRSKLFIQKTLVIKNEVNTILDRAILQCRNRLTFFFCKNTMINEEFSK